MTTDFDDLTFVQWGHCYGCTINRSLFSMSYSDSQVKVQCGITVLWCILTIKEMSYIRISMAGVKSGYLNILVLSYIPDLCCMNHSVTGDWNLINPQVRGVVQNWQGQSWEDRVDIWWRWWILDDFWGLLFQLHQYGHLPCGQHIHVQLTDHLVWSSHAWWMEGASPGWRLHQQQRHLPEESSGGLWLFDPWAPSL